MVSSSSSNICIPFVFVPKGSIGGKGLYDMFDVDDTYNLISGVKVEHEFSISPVHNLKLLLPKSKMTWKDYFRNKVDFSHVTYQWAESKFQQ